MIGTVRKRFPEKMKVDREYLILGTVFPGEKREGWGKYWAYLLYSAYILYSCVHKIDVMVHATKMIPNFQSFRYRKNTVSYTRRYL